MAALKEMGFGGQDERSFCVCTSAGRHGKGLVVSRAYHTSALSIFAAL